MSQEEGVNVARALRKNTYDDYNAARTLDFPNLASAIRAAERVERRSAERAIPQGDRAFHAQVAAALYSMMAVAATDGVWGGTAHLAEAQLRAQRASETAIANQSAEVEHLRIGSDPEQLRRAASRLGRWATDFAMDVPNLGMLPEAAHRHAEQAFRTAARAYRLASEVAPNPERRGHFLIDAAVAFDCAAREAAALNHDRDASEFRRAAFRSSSHALRAYWDSYNRLTEPVSKFRVLSKAEIAAAYRATLVELRGGVTPRTQQLRNYHRDLRDHFESATAAMLATQAMTPAEVTFMRVVQGARIVNRINDVSNRTRAQSELTNCQRVVVCGLAFLDGAPIPAPARTYGSDQSERLVPMYEAQYDARFVQMPTAGDIVDYLTRSGPGARGLVFVRRANDTGHILIAANELGAVRFLEFQSGKVHDLSADRADIANEAQAQYRFLLTDDPVRGIAMADPRAAAQRAERVLAAIADQTVSKFAPQSVAQPSLSR